MTTFDQLVRSAQSLVVDGNRALLGITGPPGVGKTTLAEQLIQTPAPAPPPALIPYQWVAHVSMDGFHLADDELARLHRRERKALRTPSTPPASRHSTGLTAIRLRMALCEAPKVQFGSEWR